MTVIDQAPDFAALEAAMSVGRTVLLSLAALFASVIVHEFGHLAAAVALRFDVCSFEIGNGAPLVRLDVCGARVEFAQNPVTWLIAGRVEVYRAIGGTRARNVALLSAGALANAVAAVGLDWASTMHDNPDFALFGFFQAIQGLVNLWPVAIRRGGVVVRSDGAKILALLRGAAPATLLAPQTYAAVMGLAGVDPMPSPIPRHAGRLANLMTTPAPGPGGAEAKRMLFEADALLRRPLARHEEIFVLDRLLTHAVVEAPQLFPGRLDSWSARLLRADPGRKSSWGTRGAALFHLGRREESRSAFAKAEYAQLFDVAINECFLARIAAKADDIAGARASLARANDARLALGEKGAWLANLFGVTEAELNAATPGSRAL